MTITQYELREWRETRGLTQAAAAPLFGCALRHYSDMERGLVPLGRHEALVMLGYDAEAAGQEAVRPMVNEEDEVTVDRAKRRLREAAVHMKLAGGVTVMVNVADLEHLLALTEVHEQVIRSAKSSERTLDLRREALDQAVRHCDKNMPAAATAAAREFLAFLSEGGS